MGFDNIFQGGPPPGVPNGPSLGLDITTGTLYISNSKTGSWTKVSGSATPAGSSGNIQFNNSGAFGGSSAIITSGGSITIPAGQDLLVSTTSNLNTWASWPGILVASAGTTEQFWFGEVSGNPGYGICTLVSSNGVQGVMGYTHGANGGSWQIGTASNHPILFLTNGNTQYLLDAAHGSWVGGSGNVIGWSSQSSLFANSTSDTGFSRTGPASVALGAGSFAQANGSLTLGNTTLTSAAPTVAASQVGLGSTTATSATTGSNGDVPAQVLGYLIANVAGTAVKIPYYSS